MENVYCLFYAVVALSTMSTSRVQGEHTDGNNGWVSECAKLGLDAVWKIANKANNRFGIRSLDPLYLDDSSISLRKHPVNAKILLKNMKINSLSRYDDISIVYDDSTRRLDVVVDYPGLSSSGLYNVNGKLLEIIPLRGVGSLIVNVSQVKIHASARITVARQKISVDNIAFDCDLRPHIRLSNLSNNRVWARYASVWIQRILLSQKNNLLKKASRFLEPLLNLEIKHMIEDPSDLRNLINSMLWPSIGSQSSTVIPDRKKTLKIGNFRGNLSHHIDHVFHLLYNMYGKSLKTLRIDRMLKVDVYVFVYLRQIRISGLETIYRQSDIVINNDLLPSGVQSKSIRNASVGFRNVSGSLRVSFSRRQVGELVEIQLGDISVTFSVTLTNRKSPVLSNVTIGHSKLAIRVIRSAQKDGSRNYLNVERRLMKLWPKLLPELTRQIKERLNKLFSLFTLNTSENICSSN